MSKSKSEDGEKKVKKDKEKKEKKEKKERRSEKDGVHKKEKSSKKDKKIKPEALEKVLAQQPDAVKEVKVAAPTAADKAAGYEAQLNGIEDNALVPFASPLADIPQSLQVLRAITAAASNDTIKRGVKEVLKEIKRNGKGVVIIGADISPMDVISHFPIHCEDHSVDYIFIRSRACLGDAGNTKRPTSVVMIIESDKNKEYSAIYDAVKQMVKSAAASAIIRGYEHL